MRRLFSPGKLLVVGLVVAAVVLGLLVWPSNEYIFLPDTAHPVSPLVSVPGGHPPRSGRIYFVDVVVRKATLLERLFGGLHSNASLYPADAINPPCTSDAEVQLEGLADMRRSQSYAAAVALSAAGKHVVIRPVGALVANIDPGFPAACKLKVDDVITAVDGKRVRGVLDLYHAMLAHPAGHVVRFTVQRGASTLLVPLKTVPAPGSGRAVVGIEVEGKWNIRLPIAVRINSGNVGGPSAGLAFALDVYAELGHDILRGHSIAATGEIEPDGTVLPIGGVKQKTVSARNAHVDAFLVPAGDNYTEARKDAHGLRVIAVKSFRQALRALATLPPSQ